MRNLKRLLLATAALIPISWVEMGQVNVVPQVGLITSVIKYSTFGAAITLVPAANSTDVVCINSSTKQNISLKRVQVSLANNGNTVSIPVSLLHRQVLDTSGSGTSIVPGAFSASNPISPSTAIGSIYTAVPTINDANPATIRTQLLVATSNVSSQQIANQPIVWQFGEGTDSWFAYAAELPKGITGQWCVNFNAVASVPTTAFIDLEWLEN